MAPDSLWEVLFLMVILKIPILYLCVVVWYAIKAEPRRRPDAPVAVRAEPDGPGPGWGRRGRQLVRPPRPHGGPSRLYPRTPRTAYARAKADRR